MAECIITKYHCKSVTMIMVDGQQVELGAGLFLRKVATTPASRPASGNVIRMPGKGSK